MLAHHTGERRRRRRRPLIASGGRRSPQARFFIIASLLTAAVVVLLVPTLTQIVETMMSYDPPGYDPRDFARTTWIQWRGVTDIFEGAEAYLSIAFLLLCAVYFMLSSRD
ncbi:MAG TPA: hypothetical protein VEA38_13470 [Terriglobales bacterium]|nr:hypothetical protein [Terriglobales bacterium]